MDPGGWPAGDGGASSSCSTRRARLERRLLERVDRRSTAPDGRPTARTRFRSRRRAAAAPARLDRARSRRASPRGDDPLLAPLRVAWLPEPRDGGPRRALRELLAARRSARSRAAAPAVGRCAGIPSAARSSPASRRRSPSCASAGAAPAAPTSAQTTASPSSSRARRRSRSSAPSAACAARATRCRASCARTSSRGRRSAAASRAWRASSASPRRRSLREAARYLQRDRRHAQPATSSTSPRS